MGFEKGGSGDVLAKRRRLLNVDANAVTGTCSSLVAY